MKILDKINKYVEQKNKEISKILNPKKDYEVSFLKKGKTKNLALLDNNKTVVVGDYNFYGIFQPNTNLWIWASSIPGVEIRHIKNIKKIKSFDYLFESDSDPKINFYYQLLTQDVLLIQNHQMLEWINDLLLYLSNDIYPINPTNSDDTLQFITLSKITEKYV